MSAQVVTWTGSTDQNWSDGSNWDTFSAPGAGDTVVIPDVTGLGRPQPVLDGNVTLPGGATLEIDNSAGNNSTLDLNSFNLNIAGGITIETNTKLLLEGG